MKIGENGLKLLKELKNTRLTTFHKSTIDLINEENIKIQSLLTQIESSTTDQNISSEISINYIFLKNILDRNLRIIRCYKYKRLLKIVENFFERKEEEMANEYLNFKNRFISIFEERKKEFEFLDFYDLEPPIKFFVQIYTLNDCGVIIDNDELIELKKNRVYYVKIKAVQHLILLGMVKIIE